MSDIDDISAEISLYASFGVAPPSSTIAELESMVSGMGQGGLDLLDAYEKLRKTAPDLAAYLENSEQTVSIYFGNVPAIAGASCTKARGGCSITIPRDNRGEDTRITAARLGHEGFHASIRLSGAQGWKGQTVANEAFAYSMGYHVAYGLGIGEIGAALWPLSGELQFINPYSATLGSDLDDARGAINRAYSQILREEIQVPWATWPGFLGLPIGRGKFLDVSRSVWIK